MTHFPSTAEELYDRVCTLQAEQQATQQELRMIQRRIEQLRNTIDEHQSAAADQHDRQKIAAEKLDGLRLEVRRCEAEKTGAMLALANAESELHEKHKSVLRAYCSSGREACSADSTCVSPSEIACQAAECHSDPKESSQMPNASLGENQSEAASPERGGVRGASRAVSLLPLSGAEAHALLSSLQSKLSRCLVYANESTSRLATSLEVRAADAAPAAAADDGAGESQAAADQSTGACQQSAIASAAVDGPTSGSPSPSVSTPATAEAAEPSDGTVSHSPLLTPPPVGKKQVLFAAADRFQRVTPVPAVNLNRHGRPPPPKPPQHPSSSAAPQWSAAQVAGSGAAHPPAVSPSPSLTPPAAAAVTAPATTTPATKFTVRLASRSSTLLAEAAALGAKRQRTVFVTPHSDGPFAAARRTTHVTGSAGTVCAAAPASAAATSSSSTSSSQSSCSGDFVVSTAQGDVSPVTGAAGDVAVDAAELPRGLESSAPVQGTRQRRTVWKWLQSPVKEQ